MLGVALDESADDVRPWVEAITFPVLLDREHLVSELYTISNVPTVVWIDEADRIVRPNSVAFGTDTFVEFTGVTAAPHLDAVRRWVTTGELPTTPDHPVDDLTEDEIRARLHFRLATHARRHSDEATARRHFEQAARLAPHDWTVRRAAMPLQGTDPFGVEFFDMYQKWQQAGSPYHGLPAMR